ncbi:MAG TPA: hypothetical protein VK923_10695 [Euzebyales bacterium]|nr:hypothetical protein [Euzebyales bacterium]
MQVIQGRTNDPTALRAQWEQWDQQLKPGAKGFLGGTAGVTAEGEFIALVRFEDETAALANSERAEQDAWWSETSQYVDEPTFHDCTFVDVLKDGGSDDAGFVQVIQGTVNDVDKARDIDRAMQGTLGDLRPAISNAEPTSRHDGTLVLQSVASGRKSQAGPARRRQGPPDRRT